MWLKLERRNTALDSQINALGLSTHNVASDGNCLFRAATYAAYNDKNKYSEYRASVAGYMRQKE